MYNGIDPATTSGQLYYTQLLVSLIKIDTDRFLIHSVPPYAYFTELTCHPRVPQRRILRMDLLLRKQLIRLVI